jgi:type II secretory pathway component PulK
MAIEHDEARFETRKARARMLAEGGFNAAIGEIQAALARGEAPADRYEFKLPIYVYRAQGNEVFPQAIEVKIGDESARINLNHAPLGVLTSVGFDPAPARALIASLPGNGKSGAWLTSLDELRTRKILTPEEFSSLDKELFTVYSATDPASPRAFLNLNTMSARALAAVFNIPKDEAAELAQKRPFADWRDVVGKTGRDPSTYNIKPPSQDGNQLPDALSLTSRAFHITCSAIVESESRRRNVRYPVEAVVLFLDNGNYIVRHWASGTGSTAVTTPLVSETPGNSSGAVEVLSGASPDTQSNTTTDAAN